jgi:hypothetical protein
VKLKARGLTHEEIAHRVGICEATVSRVLSKPLTRAEISDFATRLGVDRQQLRETVKVSLPLIRPIRSRRPPQVLVMETTNARDLHHPAVPPPLHIPMLGCILREG